MKTTVALLYLLYLVAHLSIHFPYKTKGMTKWRLWNYYKINVACFFFSKDYKGFTLNWNTHLKIFKTSFHVILFLSILSQKNKKKRKKKKTVINDTTN